MIRIQFELPEDKAKELENLMEEIGITTKKDFINNALTLFEWAINEKRKGRVIASLDEQNKNYRELVMPALEAVSKKMVESPQEAASVR